MMQNLPSTVDCTAGWTHDGVASSSSKIESGPSGFSDSAAAAVAAVSVPERLWPDPTLGVAPVAHSSDLSLAVRALTDRLSQNGKADPSTEDTLTLLLGYTNLLAEGRVAARRLLKHFGSLGAVFGASSKALRSVLGENSEAVALLRSIHHAMVQVLREPVAERPLLKNTTALRDYLHISLAHEDREVVRLLFLDSTNSLILDELHSQGTVSHVPVYPREIVRRLIETNATALIIVHNHPSGDPTPSAEDIEMTKLISRVLAGIGVTLQDSVVVGRRGCVSLRSRGLI